MRRGFEFEILLNRLIQNLNAAGIHAHKNYARRTSSGIYLDGEPFDFEVFHNGVFTTFDAKECAGERWSLKNAKPHQIKNLLACAKNGARAYFLVWFRKLDKIVRFDATQVNEALANGKKSLSPDDGTPWSSEAFYDNKH